MFTYCSVEGAGVIDALEVAVVIVNNFVNCPEPEIKKKIHYGQ